MLVSDFDFDLPSELIAQHPLPDRAASRMLYLRRDLERFVDKAFGEFPTLLRADDLVVFNNTRVLPARLYAQKEAFADSGRSAKIEVLLTRQLKQVETSDNDWQCLVRPGKRVAVGDRLVFGPSDELRGTVVDRGEFGERTIRFDPIADFFGIVEKIGRVPLPPYIRRSEEPSGENPDDRERYQTIYARDRGSVAAPTAGLHFTAEILDQLRERGIETAELTLHVGLGTFQPIRVEKIEDHRMHRERYSIKPEAADAINDAVARSRRIVAIGTTTVRTLEHAALGGPIRAGEGETDIFIYPGFKFRLVGALLTNFHLPKSTLLMLVSAFAGRNSVLDAYRHAVSQRYRFFSYGDCMFIE